MDAVVTKQGEEDEDDNSGSEQSIIGHHRNTTTAGGYGSTEYDHEPVGGAPEVRLVDMPLDSPALYQRIGSLCDPSHTKKPSTVMCCFV